KANVPEWLPRWTPWTPASATLTLCNGSNGHHRIASWLKMTPGLNIEWSDDGLPNYEHPDNVHSFEGSSAIAAAFTHKNFAYALVGQAWLLFALPWVTFSGMVSGTRR
ncbi:MAG: hypothetical protein ABJ327_25300, partial [Litoreibacter sp.]